MKLAEYSGKALSFALDTIRTNKNYAALGLCEEAGEVAGKLKKHLRGDVSEMNVKDLLHELGDVLWYANIIGYQHKLVMFDDDEPYSHKFVFLDGKTYLVDEHTKDLVDEHTKDLVDYLSTKSIQYLSLRLCEAAGDVASLICDSEDGDYIGDVSNFQENLVEDLNSVAACLFILSTKLGSSLEEVAEMNIKKLSDRQDRNKIKGSGDHR